MTLYRSLLVALGVSLLSAQAIAAGPEEKTSGQGVRYLSGGIGQTEMAAIKEAASRYNLDLTFTTNSGHHMAGVQVSVKNAKGQEVLNAVSDGPKLLADLPPGQFTVVAAAEGKTQTRKVSLAKGQRRHLVLRWPDDGAAAGQQKTGSAKH